MSPFLPAVCLLAGSTCWKATQAWLLFFARARFDLAFVASSPASHMEIEGLWMSREVCSHWRSHANLRKQTMCLVFFQMACEAQRRAYMFLRAREARVRRGAASQITWGSREKSRIPSHTCKPMLRLTDAAGVTRADCALEAIPISASTKMYNTRTLICTPIRAATMCLPGHCKNDCWGVTGVQRQRGATE